MQVYLILYASTVREAMQQRYFALINILHYRQSLDCFLYIWFEAFAKEDQKFMDDTALFIE